jgi:hypothetical protein
MSAKRNGRVTRRKLIVFHRLDELDRQAVEILVSKPRHAEPICRTRSSIAGQYAVAGESGIPTAKGQLEVRIMEPRSSRRATTWKLRTFVIERRAKRKVLAL